MVFPGMYLTYRPTYTWPIVSHYNEQVLGDKSQIIVHLHDLYVGESLAI
ncbi:MAG: hypothetical protein OXP68_02555 [Anaerolineaceae bacterium]|nr:hypothetical protein [Anaerolineaceae bacterium]MDE0328112.1 hypothetical protein [Anaerolineaceae bacterium]